MASLLRHTCCLIAIIIQTVSQHTQRSSYKHAVLTVTDTIHKHPYHTHTPPSYTITTIHNHHNSSNITIHQYSQAQEDTNEPHKHTVAIPTNTSTITLHTHYRYKHYHETLTHTHTHICHHHIQKHFSHTRIKITNKIDHQPHHRPNTNTAQYTPKTYTQKQIQPHYIYIHTHRTHSPPYSLPTTPYTIQIHQFLYFFSERCCSGGKARREGGKGEGERWGKGREGG